MPKTNCFHCDLPIVNKVAEQSQSTPPPFLHSFQSRPKGSDKAVVSAPLRLSVFGEQQVFCCHGCKAVCEAIVSSGNSDYYKHREGSARTFNSKELPMLLDKLKLYDNEKIQREFVRADKKNEWKEAWLILEEIRCAACLWLNEKTLRQLDGIIDVQMDYTGQQARVRWNPDKIQLSDILRAITQIGYIAHPFDPEQREVLNKEQKQRSLQRIIFALILGMLVMQSAIAGYFMGDVNNNGELPLWMTISRWSSVFATALILLYPGQLFFINAWRDLKNKSLGMDVPIVIGLSVAWLGSLYSTILGAGDVYFESIVMFVILLLISRHIELRSRIMATALLDRSAKIIPKSTQILTNGKYQETPVIELKVGDQIQVSPGETVPVDGLLLSAKSSFDESLISGESLPVTHIKGDHVIGGAINVEQIIELEVLSEKSESTLNEIHQLTQSSTKHRPYYVDIAEKVAGKFVAVILLIAVSTLLFWTFKGSTNALSNMIAVLIVTCPCALALAAPVALSLGAGRLSQLHILPIRMSAIEKLSQIGTLVFDKTGTLTMGIPIVKDVLAVTDIDKTVCLRVAAGMEQGSQHPFAKAIILAAKDVAQDLPKISIKEIKHISGEGVKAEVEVSQQTTEWRLGNSLFCNFQKDELSVENNEQIRIWRELGYSVLYLCNNTGLLAVFCIVDPLRDQIKEFIDDADKLGISRKVILSGDHQQSVNAIAKQLGIEEAYGGLSPTDKLEWIKVQRSQANSTNNKILMLGDGINDAPIMAAADVSMTFSDATDLAKNNGDFILLGKGFNNLSSAFVLMRKTRNIIIQNLGWAIAYNLIAIPAAVIGWVTPWMAAIGMSASSLLVVLNSLRLKKR